MSGVETASGLDKVIERFADKLSALEKAGSQATEDQILQALLARDSIQADLESHREVLPGKAYELLQLDGRLRKLASPITRLVSLETWRATFRPPSDNWWWSFETVLDQPDRLGWLWSSLAALLLTVAISLLVDISARFLKGTPDTVGTFAVVSQGLILMLTAGGVLTHSGRETIDRAFRVMSIPRFYWARLKAGLAILLFLMVVCFRFFLPSIAVLYNNRGLESYRAGQITSALSDYNRAIALHPDYAEAHYNLARLDEDLQDLDAARSEYRIAVQGRLDAAYNNLARLYILQDSPNNAVVLLLNGLDQVQDPQIRYSMLKNLGWARVEQARFNEAETYLRSAIALAPDAAPAHCLLAQVVESQGKTDEATQEWTNCLKFASIRDPDEDAWIAQARTRLEKGSGGQP